MKKVALKLYSLMQTKAAAIVVISLLLISFVTTIYINIPQSTDATDTLPLAPSNVTATDGDNRSSVSLHWQDNANNESDYIVSRSPSIWHAFEIIATLPADSTEYVDLSNFVTGQRYYYKVTAKNDVGSSAESRIVTPTREELKDYLAGTGEFETSFTSDQQRYTSTNNAIGERVESTPENSIATNWSTSTQYNLDPENDYFFRLTEGGIAGSKQQCFGIKNNDQSNSLVVFRAGFNAGREIRAEEFSSGDTIKFVVDKISYLDSQNLPAGVTKNFQLLVYQSGSQVAMREVAGSPDLNISPTSIEQEYSVGVPGQPDKAIDNITFDFMIRVSGSNLLGSKTPGICMDGAHMYIKKAGQQNYTSVTVPAREEHIEKNYLSHAESNVDNPYYIAQNYDHVSMSYAKDSLRVPAKYFNPNIKFFMYTARSLSDYRSSANDTINNDVTLSPENRFPALVLTHSNWFIPYDPVKLTPPSGDTREEFKKTLPGDTGPVNYIFDDYYQTEYMVNLTDPTSTPEHWVPNQEFLNWWKTETTNRAVKRGFDGVFLDVSGARQVIYDKTPAYSASTCQELGYQGIMETVNGTRKERCIVYNVTAAQGNETLKIMVSYLKENGLLVTMNCAGCHLGDGNTDCYFDPRNEGNTPLNTPDSHFQEHSFLGIKPRDLLLNHNYYRTISQWNQVITDMQQYEEINNTLPETEKKDYYVSTYGFNKLEPDPSGANPFPADPIDSAPNQNELSNLNKYNTGWAKFVLSSYLIGSNPHSYLSIVYDDYNYLTNNMDRKEYPLDNKMLDQLGESTNDRYVQYNGQAYQYGDAILDSDNDVNRAVNYRRFEHGLSVANADSNNAHNFVMPGNYTDEYGRVYASGTTINLSAHTGRIFFSYVGKAPAVELTSQDYTITTKNPSLTVRYNVNGIEKSKEFNLNVGRNDLSITEADQIDSSAATTVNFTVYRSDSVSLNDNKFANGWNMVAFPDISENSALASILPESFRVRKYISANNRYEKFEESKNTPSIGDGYWVKIDDKTKINSVRYSYNSQNSITVPVSKGWNLLGNPFQSDLPLANLRVKYKDGTSKSFTDAVQKKEVYGYAWSWEAAEKNYHFISTDPNRYKTEANIPKESTIKSYRGFWLIINSDRISDIIMNK